MVLDTRTLFVMTLILSLVMGICLLVTARKDYPRVVQKSMRLWGLAYLLQTIGFLLGGLRGYIPDLFSVALANLFLLWATAEIYHALRIFDSRPPQRMFSYAVVIVGLAICWILLSDPDSLPARIVLVSLVSVFFFSISGIQLIRPPEGKPGLIRRILSSGFWLLALIYLFRAVLTLGPDSTIPSLLANSPLQTMVFGGTGVGVIIISVGFLLMCTERLTTPCCAWPLSMI